MPGDWAFGAAYRLGVAGYLMGVAAIDGLAPGGAGEEGGLAVDLAPGSGTMEFQECLLEDIFGVVGVAEHGGGDAEDEAGLAGHRGIETGRVETGVFVFRWRAGIAPRPVPFWHAGIIYLRSSAKTDEEKRVFGFILWEVEVWICRARAI